MKAAGNSVLKVGKGVASVVANPEATAKGVGAGVKRFGTDLGRKAKRGAEDARRRQRRRQGPGEREKSTGDKAADAGTGAAKSVLGVNARTGAGPRSCSVDPYTSNPVLSKALDGHRPIDAAGGIAAKVVVPVPMSWARRLRWAASSGARTPRRCRKMNEQRVAELGTPQKEASAFFRNKASPWATRRASSPRSTPSRSRAAELRGHRGEAQNERQVVFFTESAELLQLFHAKTPVSAILPDSRAVVAKTQDGRAVILLAVDYVRWSEAFEKSLKEILERGRASSARRSSSCA